ncbi:YebG family protein [Shewanella psychrotolerans]|uniref:YebG family protein n=1 Tax=Shewanella psychrotolerans TaxID=2864206 RepID=UPI001C65CB6B|nr:YebG family protein [Shewanella psychrotolerans]QYK03012.1 YebG family protein [Shewanella psychrotolerans]
MAVITKFVVVREGVEKMTFTSKKEADAYDKMLDIADNLLPFIEQSALGLDDSATEKLCFYLAENKDQLMGLLKGGVAPKSAPTKKAAKKPESKT